MRREILDEKAVNRLIGGDPARSAQGGARSGRLRGEATDRRTRRGERNGGRQGFIQELENPTTLINRKGVCTKLGGWTLLPKGLFPRYNGPLQHS
eukprot:3878797-Amphidinium_carterae.1